MYPEAFYDNDGKNIKFIMVRKARNLSKYLHKMTQNTKIDFLCESIIFAKFEKNI